MSSDATEPGGCSLILKLTCHPLVLQVRYYRRSEGRVSFFAARDIEAGEELIFDYGRDL